MTERVQVNIDGHIAEVVLSRAEKMNALDQDSFAQLVAAAESISKNNQLRAVLIYPEGEHFCAGADKAFLQGAVSDTANFSSRALQLEPGDTANEFQKPVMSWLELDVPVVVCMPGVAYGAGMQLALAADIRIGSATTAMSLFEIHWGLIPDMGITQTLPRLVRADVATELVLTGRTVESQEALALGLLTRVEEEPLKAARTLVAHIASKSPDASKRGKMLFRDSAGLSRAEGLKLEAQLQSELVGTPNQMEAAMANLQKRVAKFN